MWGALSYYYGTELFAFYFFKARFRRDMTFITSEVYESCSEVSFLTRQGCYAYPVSNLTVAVLFKRISSFV